MCAQLKLITLGFLLKLLGKRGSLLPLKVTSNRNKHGTAGSLGTWGEINEAMTEQQDPRDDETEGMI